MEELIKKIEAAIARIDAAEKRIEDLERFAGIDVGSTGSKTGDETVTRDRDPFRTVTPALKWREALEDLIAAAAEEGVIIGQSVIDCCCHGYHSVPDMEIINARSGTGDVQYLDTQFK